jgi:hypothetical protein
MNIKVIRNIIVRVSGAFFLVVHSSVWALNWTVHPSLDFEEVFSDNINQTNSDKESAFVTEISPGISVNGTSAVSTFDFNYRMQTLYNAGGNSGIDINNQLQMNTNYEFVRNKLYLDSSSSISQQNVSNRRIASDNISGGEDTTNVATFRISPYWTPHFKEYADGVFRATYDRVSTDGGSSELSDTDTFSQNIILTSGRRFSYINWSLAFNNSHQKNSDSEDVDFQDSLAVIRYALGRKFNVFARVGHSNNSFAGDSESNNNGVFYTFGGEWRPNQSFRLEAGYGNNSFVTVDISPFRRLHWITTYTNNDIGLNTGGNGETWDTALNYNTRRSVWTLSYNEQTTTTQEVLLDDQIFSVEDAFGDRDVNLDGNLNPRLPSLTDDVFIAKRAQLSVSFRTGKSDLSANIFRTTRDFELSGNEEKVTGISGSWDWRFTRRSSLLLRSGWQKTESDGVDSFSDKLFNVSARATRNFITRLGGRSARLDGYLEYRFLDQNSDDNLNSYQENRVTAGLTLQY